MMVILDTSVIIAFLLSTGKNFVREIIRQAKNRKMKLIASKETISELKKTLAYQSIKRLPNYKPHLVASFVAWYQYNVVYHSLEDKKIFKELRDVKDNIFLQLALVSKADYIITGDKDLLVVNRIKSTKIITTEEFFSLETI
ncbi:MAG: putative toxin-antitoxin system toxin component, PIN family [Patescibacteria group bacterium]